MKKPNATIQKACKKLGYTSKSNDQKYASLQRF